MKLGKPSEARKKFIAEHREKRRLEQLAESEVTETVEMIAGAKKTVVRQGGVVVLVGGPETFHCPKRGHEVAEYIYRSTQTGEIELRLPMAQAPSIFKQATTTTPTTTKPADEPIEVAREKLQLLREIVENTRIARGQTQPLKWNATLKKFED